MNITKMNIKYIIQNTQYTDKIRLSNILYYVTKMEITKMNIKYATQYNPVYLTKFFCAIFCIVHNENEYKIC